MRPFPFMAYAVAWRPHPDGGLVFRSLDNRGDDLIRWADGQIDTLYSFPIVVEAQNLIIASASGRREPPADLTPRLESIESMEKRLIRKILAETGWQRAQAAEILGINRTTLWQKIKRYELEEPS